MAAREAPRISSAHASAFPAAALAGPQRARHHFSAASIGHGSQHAGWAGDGAPETPIPRPGYSRQFAIWVSMTADAPIASSRSMMAWASPRRTMARTAHHSASSSCMIVGEL